MCHSSRWTRSSEEVLDIVDALEIRIHGYFKKLNSLNIYRVKKAFLGFQVHRVIKAFPVQKGLQGHRGQR